MKHKNYVLSILYLSNTVNALETSHENIVEYSPIDSGRLLVSADVATNTDYLNVREMISQHC